MTKRKAVMVWLLCFSIPVGIFVGHWLVPVLLIDWHSRFFVHIFAFFLCHFPYYFGRYISRHSPAWATGVHLSANALRIGGIFFILFFFRWYKLSIVVPALELYAISVASFLLFQLVALWVFRRDGYRA